VEASEFRMGRAALWAMTWALGAAMGVALGGWLTVVGGVGAPGIEALDLGTDVFLLPALSGLVVFVVHLGGQIIVASLRSRAVIDSSGDSAQSDEDEQ